MTRIDNLLIEKVYSPFAGWAQHRAGADQWRLSLECLNGTVAFHLAGVAITIAHKGVADGIFADLVAATLWLAIMQLIRSAAQRQAASSLGRQTARLREGFFRLLLLAILPLSLFYIRGLDNLCHTASLVLFISHLYFKACDMPPPRRQTKRTFAYAQG